MQQHDSAQSDRHWLQVGEFVADFGGNEPGAVDALAGRTLQLNFEGGASEHHRFASTDTLEISVGDQRRQTKYRATELRPGVVLVDQLEHPQRAHTETMIIDLNRGACTKVIGVLPGREAALVPLFTRVLNKQGLSAVDARFVHGAVDAPFTASTHRHTPTDELVGRRVYHEYGGKDAYEHIYLESDLYSWHCIMGPEVGLADTDKCFTYKLGEQLYLFVWIEKIIPTIGVLMMDYAAWRTTGKIFGYKGADFGETVNSPVGAVSRLINTTKY